MRKKGGISAVALIAVASSSMSVRAQAPDSSGLGYLSAGELERRCTESAPTSVSLCFSYIAAVRDTMRAYGVWLGQSEFCERKNVAQSDLRNAFLGYLRAYPSARKGQAASTIVVALKDSFPCASAQVGSHPTLPARPPVIP